MIRNVFPDIALLRIWMTAGMTYAIPMSCPMVSSLALSFGMVIVSDHVCY